MFRLSDIYYKVGSRLYEQDYKKQSVEDKKQILENELKEFLLEKIAEFGGSERLFQYEESLNVNDLFEVLGEIIPMEQHSKTLGYVTHYVLGLASVTQGKTILWWSNNSNVPLGETVINFDDRGLWDTVNTNEEESYVNSFKVVYNVFMNDFMEKQKVKSIRNPKDKA